MVYAWGYGGQMIYVVPDLALTVVMTSAIPRARNGHTRALHRLLARTIIPAVALNQQKLSSMNATSPSELEMLLLIIGPILAFGGAVLGATIGARGAVLQVIETSRIKWLDDLRDHASEFLTTVSDFRSRLRYAESSEKKELIQSEGSTKISLLDYKIRLMLNPNEKCHRKTSELVNHILNWTPPSTVSEGG